MKTLFALGNPGDRYRDTRHNVGWWLADRLRAAWSLPGFRRREGLARTRGRAAGEPVRLVKPLTYVNRSGRALEAAMEEAPELRVESDLLVLVDDVDLPPGGLRLKARGSAGGHNGLASLEAAAGTRGYARLRLGVGRPDDDRVDLADWVLAPPSAAEEEEILGAFDRAVDAVECWIAEGAETAMNRFN